MALQIPREHLPAIRKILDLPDASIEELIVALSSAQITADASAMAERIATSVPSIPPEELNDIVDMLYSFYHVRQFAEIGRSRFIRDLLDTLTASSDFSLAKSDAVAARDRFQRLLNIKTLNVLSKAVRLQRDGERIYCGSRIVSDIRPVFGVDVGGKPVSAVITHTLAIGYHEMGEHKEFFIVLDEQDLHALGDVLERAVTKGATLTDLLKSSDIPRLGV